MKLWYYTLLLLLLYLILPTYFPGLGAANSNGTKFLVLAGLNILAYLGFLSYKDRHSRPGNHSSFFRTIPGIIYSLFLLVSLLSVFHAINITEAVFTFFRTVSVFAAVFMLFTLFRLNRGLLQQTAILLSFLLLADSFTVLYGIIRFIVGQVSSIYDIQSVYTNKNILAAAVFLKLSASLWLIFFDHGWKRYLGSASLFFGMLALFFLSTRTFYIGLALLTTTLLAYSALRYIMANDRAPAKHFLQFSGWLLLSLCIFSLTQHYLYPKDKDTWNYNKSVVSRVTEIKTEVSQARQPVGVRLSSWERTMKLIREHPLFGVGTGNWKIAVLKYENQERSDFHYMLKNHNDFAEITAETGLPGGLLFVSVIILIMFSFIKAAFDPAKDSERLKMIFIPAFGMLA